MEIDRLLSKDSLLTSNTNIQILKSWLCNQISSLNKPHLFIFDKFWAVINNITFLILYLTKSKMKKKYIKVVIYNGPIIIQQVYNQLKEHLWGSLFYSAPY